MQIDLDHLHYWMNAIRESDDPKRTLDAFWKGQINSKVWLINNLKPFITKEVTVDIYGGWVGVLASLLFQSGLPIKKIQSIDIDPSCEPIATMMNKGEEMQGKFKALTANMCDILPTTADVVVNTSCEHISQEQYNKWISLISDNCLIVLQSNNYKISEHIRNAQNIDEFIEQSNLNVFFSSTLHMPLYDRYMIIGKRSNV